VGPGCRSERGARAEGGELRRFREKVGRARDGERVRRTVRAAGLSERTESGKGREWERAGPRRGEEAAGPAWKELGRGERGGPRVWATGLGWGFPFLFLFLLPFSFSNYTQTNLNSNQI